MGQKVNPTGLRLGINKNWKSRWFPDKKVLADNIEEDYIVRKFLKKEAYFAGVSDIIIERATKKIKATLVLAKPGMVIGKKGADIDALKNKLSKLVNKEAHINIKEERKPNSSAQLAAESVSLQLEKRIAFRRAMKKVIQNALRDGVKGIKLQVSGRLGGAEMARREWYLEGRVPLHTLRASIDYGQAEAHTTYGIVGIKCWIFKGEMLAKNTAVAEKLTPKPRKKREHTEDKG